MPLVSVLIPAYNAEKWLAQTMQSAIDQTWTHKEIIVVDDGSTDRTLEVANRLSSSSVKVVSQVNAGACAARNEALRHAQGDFIQWLDADDLLHPEKIARQLEHRGARTNATVLTCSWGKFFFRPEKAKMAPDELWRDLAPIEWILTRFVYNVWMNPTVWLLDRALVDKAGPWDTRLSRSGDDDGEYICRVLRHSDGVEFVKDAQCYYRIGSVGSLNWNMERNEESLNAFALSLRLTVSHLLALENSPRSRAASLQYLQTFFPYFYDAPQELLDDLRELARDLGGTLSQPQLNWKYQPLEKVLGPRVAKNAMSNWRAVKLLAHGKLDKLLFDIAR